MYNPLSFRIVGMTFLFALTISYAICIGGDVLFGWTMYRVWGPLLPGFSWPLTVGGVVIGLLWLVGYSLYLTALLVLPYNYLTRKLVTAE